MKKDLTHYVDKAMFDAQPIDADALERPRVRVVWATPDPLGAIAYSMMAYEGRFPASLSEITDDERREYFDESFKTHLKAPWEFCQFHLVVEGITRANGEQMVRQRTATFAKESMRFAVKEDLKECVRPGPTIKAEFNGSREREKKYYELMDVINEYYKWFIGDGVTAEDARGVLPHDVLTRTNWRLNLSDLDHHMGNRLCTQAQFEWRYIASDLMRALSEYKGQITGYGIPHPGGGWTEEWNDWQFKYIADSGIFRPVCFKMGHCPWTSKIDRGCTIRERMDSGRANEVRTEEWLLDPTAGWVR